MGQQQLSSRIIAGFPALAAEGRGDRPLLLFIHGAFVTHEPFIPWMTVLAERGWRSVAAARRGRLGVGPEKAAGLVFADYLADTLRVIDELGEAPVIVGHSLGGLIAQKIAELGRCRGAVLLAPAPPGMLTAQPVAIPALAPMFPGIMLGRPILPGRGGCATIALNRIPEGERARLHATLTPESGKVYREMIFGTVRVDEAKVKCPMLVVGGEEDRIVSTGLMRATAKKYAADLKLYPGHAHWLLEEPGFERIVGDVGDWLEAHVAAPRAAPLRLAS